ncbi:zinc-binding dehydrogenase [candidate division KSB1 bacterium]
MKAAVLTAPKELTVREVDTPKPGAGEVLVRVKACGLCQTDYLGYIGERDYMPFPTIMGHEIAGVVTDTGHGVDGFESGDEVIVNPMINCGVCDNCRRGFEHYCRTGAVVGGDGQPTILDGAFAEYVSVPARAIYRKPPEVSFRAAALTEPLAGSYKGLIEYSQMRLGEDVVIIGAGGMGLLVTMLAVNAGAGRVVVIDKVDFRLEKARELGAHHVVNFDKGSVEDRVAEILPKGADLVFEAAGTLPAASLAMALVRHGTRVNMFGVIVPGTIPVSPREIHFLETRIDASFTVTPRVMTAAIDLMSKGLADPERIVTQVYALEDIEEAFFKMADPDRIKIVVEP